MTWEIEFTDEFEAWWNGLDEDEQIDVRASVTLLREYGPHLRFPHSSDVKASKHGQMRELRTQHKGEPYRTLYCFDPRRTAILLLGGNKTGDVRWYEVNVPLADKLYDQYLIELKKEGLFVMARKFAELEAKMSPAARAEAARRTRQMLEEIALQELRQALRLTQAEVARLLEVNQAAISKMEGQGDMHVMTLRRYIEALGGELKLVASFPDREVIINQFSERGA